MNESPEQKIVTIPASSMRGKRGGQPGNRNAQKPDSEKKRERHVMLTDGAWSKAVSTGNASGYIEALLQKED